jgi:aspartate 1-decarboxylase
MQIKILKSKIHNATVTEANLKYIGSIGIDEDLMKAANMIENEQVHVLNNNNGERIITYIIKAPAGSGIISLNGAAARKFYQGDEIIILTYASMEAEEAKKYKPVVLFPDKNNKI